MITDRLWEKTKIEASGCITWTGATTSNGYGRVWWFGHLEMAHRLFYELFVDAIPDGMELDHLCRNRVCVNVEHLEVVTHQENQARSNSPAGLNARKVRCIRGHSLLADGDVYVNARGERVCRPCRRSRNSSYKTRKKGRRLNG